MKLLRRIEGPLLRGCQWAARRWGGARGFWGVYLCDAAIDVWVRHRQVVEVLDRWFEQQDNGPRVSILDVGGEGHLSLFWPGQVDYLRYDGAPNQLGGNFIPGRVEDIPLKDNTYAAAVCIDVLEHIPPENRRKAISELRRVAPQVVIHAPCNDWNQWTGDIRGAHYDRKFNDWHVRLRGRADAHTIAHMCTTLPTIEQLGAGPERDSDQAFVQPTQNGPVWLLCMLVERVPLLRLPLAPFLAQWLLRRDREPFHAAMTTWVGPGRGLAKA